MAPVLNLGANGASVKFVVNTFQGQGTSANAIENMEFKFKIESKDGKLRCRNRSLKLTVVRCTTAQAAPARWAVSLR